MFGDEVDSIRTFNTESQRSIEKVKEFSIFPSKEVIVDDEGRNRAVQTINEELKNIVANVSNLNKESVEKIKGIVGKNIELLNNTYYFETIDSYLPFFYEKLDSFFDYLDGYNFIVDDFKRILG